MKYFFMPVDYNNYYSNNMQGKTGPWTYVGHGKGRLDFAYNCYGPIYSMTDGTVTGVGYYTGEDSMITHCDIRYYDNILKENVVIRYLHGDYPNISVGDSIKCGDQIGTISNHDKNGLQHLHIDFQDTTSYLTDTMVGEVNFENKIFTYKNKSYPLKGLVNLELLKTWNLQRGNNEANTSIGYCWLIFAQSSQYLEPSSVEDGVPLNRNQFYSGSTDSHLEAVEAYFNDEFSDNFIGPCPTDWNDLINDTNGDHKSLRCLIDFCMHELGSWPIACTLCAKLMRANVLASSYLNVSGGAGQTTTYYDWMRTVTTNLPGFIGPWEGYVDGIYIYNNGNGFINPNSMQYLAQTNENFKRVLAIYNNFKKSNYYGTNLQDSYLEKSNYLSSIIKGASIMPMANGGYWNMVSEALSNAIVNYNPVTNTDDGKINLESYYGRILVYRQDGNISYFNTQPFN